MKDKRDGLTSWKDKRTTDLSKTGLKRCPETGKRTVCPSGNRDHAVRKTTKGRALSVREPEACGPENGKGDPKRGTGACKNQGPLCRFEQSLSILKDPLIGVILLHSILKNACFA